MEDDFAKQVKKTKDEIAELEWQQNVVSLRLKRARKKLKELEGGSSTLSAQDRRERKW